MNPVLPMQMSYPYRVVELYPINGIKVRERRFKVRAVAERAARRLALGYLVGAHCEMSVYRAGRRVG